VVVSIVKQQALFIGIDGGGSKCKATIVDANNKILGTGISGPANPLHGYQQAIYSIEQSALLALADANLAEETIKQLIAGVGLAGVNLPSQMQQMQQWVHPFKKMFLTTDLSIACLGAHDGQDGAILITGTGSCGYSHVNNQEFFIGGHGFPHGDQGSGAWTGLQVVSTVLRSLDGLEVESMMNQMLLLKLKCTNYLEIVETIARKPASFFAQLASIAFDCAGQGDELALSIVEKGANYMSKLANKLWLQQPPRLSLIGGLTPVIKPYLDSKVSRCLLPPIHPPEIGAVIFAKQQLDYQA